MHILNNFFELLIIIDGYSTRVLDLISHVVRMDNAAK